jgi:hypothetical protein
MSAVWAPQVPTHADQHSGVIAEHVTAVFTVSRVARFEVAVPKPGGLRRNRLCRTATDQLWWNLRPSRTKCLDNVVVFARLEAVRGPGG